MLLTGAEILVKCLLSEGVDTIFGYPGGAALHKAGQSAHLAQCKPYGAGVCGIASVDTLKPLPFCRAIYGTCHVCLYLDKRHWSVYGGVPDRQASIV